MSEAVAGLVRCLEGLDGIEIGGAPVGRNVEIEADRFRATFQVDPLGGGWYSLDAIAHVVDMFDDASLEIHSIPGVQSEQVIEAESKRIEEKQVDSTAIGVSHSATGERR